MPISARNPGELLQDYADRLAREGHDKYNKMLKAGVPKGAVENTIMRDAAADPSAGAIPTPPVGGGGSTHGGPTIKITQKDVRRLKLKDGEFVRCESNGTITNCQSQSAPAGVPIDEMYKVKIDTATGKVSLQQSRRSLRRTTVVPPEVGDHVEMGGDRITKVHHGADCPAGCGHQYEIARIQPGTTANSFKLTIMDLATGNILTGSPTFSLAATDPAVIRARQDQQDRIDQAIRGAQEALGYGVGPSTSSATPAAGGVQVGREGYIKDGKFIEDAVRKEYKVEEISSGQIRLKRETDNKTVFLAVAASTAATATAGAQKDDPELVSAAKNICAVVVDLKDMGITGSAATVRSSINTLVGELKNLFFACINDSTKIEIINNLKAKLQEKQTSLESQATAETNASKRAILEAAAKKLENFIKDIDGLDIKENNVKAKAGEIQTKVFDAAIAIIAGINDDITRNTTRHGAEKEFLFSGGKVVAGTTETEIVIEIEPEADPVLSSNRLQRYASRQGKGANGLVAAALDGNDFDMQVLCGSLEDAFNKVHHELSDHRYTGVNVNAARRVHNRFTSEDQQTTDDTNKKMLVECIGEVVISVGSDAKKDSIFELHDQDAAGDPILAMQRGESKDAAGKTIRVLQFVIKADDLNYDAITNKDFDTSSPEGSRQAALGAAFSKGVAKGADAIGGVRAKVYLRETGTTVAKDASTYTEDDCKKLFLAAVHVFSAHVFPVIEPAVWEKILDNARTICDNDDLRKAFVALKHGLEEGLNDPIKGVEGFRQMYTRGTEYEKASFMRPLNPRAPSSPHI